MPPKGTVTVRIVDLCPECEKGHLDKKNGAWVEIHREAYNQFVENSGVGTGPVDVRVTAWTGATIEDTLPPVTSGALTQGASQF